MMTSYGYRPRPSVARRVLGLLVAGCVAFTVGAWSARAVAPHTSEVATCSAPCRIAGGRVASSWHVADLACFEDEVIVARRHDITSPWYYSCTPSDNVRRAGAAGRGSR